MGSVAVALKEQGFRVRPGYQGLEMVHPSYTRIAPDQDVPVSDRLTSILLSES